MKTAIAALLALGLIAGQANARIVFDDLGATFGDLHRHQTSAPRSAFDDLRNSAPRSAFDQIRDSAPRSDGVFGSLETGAP